MKVLLDENLPLRLRAALPGHDVRTVRYMGWLGIENGELLSLADREFDVMLTGDTQIRFQQDLSRLRRLSVVVLIVPDNRIRTLRELAPQVLDALRTIGPRTLVEIRHPAAR